MHSGFKLTVEFEFWHFLHQVMWKRFDSRYRLTGQQHLSSDYVSWCLQWLAVYHVTNHLL